VIRHARSSRFWNSRRQVFLLVALLQRRLLAHFVHKLQGVGIGDDTTFLHFNLAVSPAQSALLEIEHHFQLVRRLTPNQVIRRGFTICVLIDVAWPLNFFACRQFGHFKVQHCDFASRKRPRHCRPGSYKFPRVNELIEE